ncbi:MAG: winged helix-turn-helix transcriptional regulator [Actinobacteria bacterium]|nr:winged helix-turn-helix transcriptional regulator [Actinomycetota bacterium]
MKPLSLIACCAPLASELSDDEAGELQSLFGALADKSRVRIVSTLLRAGDACCVCDLEPELGVGQPTVSYHLKKLTDVGLLERERRGTFGYYRIAPEALDRLRTLFA